MTKKKEHHEETETETALVKSEEAPPAQLREVSFTAHLKFPEHEADWLLEQLMASIAEFGTATIHEVPQPGVQTRQQGPTHDAYGNRYDGGTDSGRGATDKYGNPWTPPERKPVDPDSVDAYGNPLNPPTPPALNHSVDVGPPRADGRPHRDAYGNEYKGRY